MIFGLEVEYGLSVRRREDGSLVAVAPEVVAEWLAQADRGGHLSSFTANGGRLYVDTGGHPEWAGPECDDPDDVVVWDRAGEQLVARWVRNAAADATRTIGRDLDVVLARDNQDAAGNSYGCHENYQVPVQLDRTTVEAFLGPFLLARQAWAGAGHYDRAGVLRHWARAAYLVTARGSASTTNRPLVHVRDEPLADQQRWWRVHVIAGDTNLCDTTTWLKVGVTALALARAATAPAAARVFGRHWPVSVPQAVAAVDRDGPAARWATRDRASVSAAELGARYWDWVAAGRDERPWAPAVMEAWGEVLEAHRTGRTDRLVGLLDVPTLGAVMEAARRRLGVRGHDWRLARLALAWAQVPDGLARRSEALGLVRRRSDDAAVTAAGETPPSGTRAALRGRFVATALATGVPAVDVSWQRCQARAVGVCLDLADPGAARLDGFGAVLGLLERCGQRLARAGTAPGAGT